MCKEEAQSTARNQVMNLVLDALNKNTNANEYILKGGYSLILCYGLSRITEDLDFDAIPRMSTRKEFFKSLDELCKSHGWSCRHAKDTETVGRCIIHYSENEKPLKVEVSYRRTFIPEGTKTTVKGVAVYDINQLCQMKCAAYLARDAIRDLNDLTFICTHYFDDLSDTTILLMQNAFGEKGLEQFDYLLATNQDTLIDTDELASNLLATMDKLGLAVVHDVPSAQQIASLAQTAFNNSSKNEPLANQNRQHM